MNENPKIPLLLAVFLAPAAALYALNAPHAVAGGVFITAALLWIGELLPLSVTALLIPVVAIAGGVLAPAEAFREFGSEIVFLFLGCFILAEAAEKHGLDRRIAFSILSARFASRTPERVVAIVAVVCFLLSMWISNTATCAMMTPVCLGLIRSFHGRLDGRSGKVFGARLLIACSFASSIGGMATPVGSPPNMIAIQLLRERGIEVGFLDWMYIGLPVAVSAMILLLAVLAWRFPLGEMNTAGIHDYFDRCRRELGPMHRAEKATAAVFGAAVVLWILPEIARTAGWGFADAGTVLGRFSPSAVALAAGAMLFMIPSGKRGTAVLEWEDAQRVDWGTLLLFGGGLTLGAILDRSGLAADLGTALFNSTPGIFVFMAAAICFSLVLSEFSSNTASTAIIGPIVVAAVAAAGFGEDATRYLVISCALGASFGFMMPVSTPPNAIIFGTKLVRFQDLMRTGVIFDLLGGAMVIGVCYLAL